MTRLCSISRFHGFACRVLLLWTFQSAQITWSQAALLDCKVIGFLNSQSKHRTQNHEMFTFAILSQTANLCKCLERYCSLQGDDLIPGFESKKLLSLCCQNPVTVARIGFFSTFNLDLNYFLLDFGFSAISQKRDFFNSNFLGAGACLNRCAPHSHEISVERFGRGARKSPAPPEHGAHGLQSRREKSPKTRL